MKLPRHLFLLFGLVMIPAVFFQARGNGWDEKALSKYDVVILYDSTFVEVKESGLSLVEQKIAIRILTPRGGAKFSTIISGYDPLSAFVKFTSAEISRKNGWKKVLDTSGVIDYPAPARAIYWGAREKMLAPGRLEPGDTLRYTLFRKGFTYALLQDDDDRYIPPMRGHFYDIVPFWNDYPVISRAYIVQIPSAKTLQYRFFNGTVESSLESNNGINTYSFSNQWILPIEKEKNMADISDVAPKLIITTSPDWQAKSAWFYNVNEEYGSFESTPEIKAKVSEILKDATGEMDSVSRLTHWVADEIRYSGISMGQGEGFTLHKGDMTFRDRAGVCKDKAGLLITMLRAAGFESYAAMTMAGSRIENIPADQFNHCVTLVKLSDDKLHLLDPTWVPFVRELWSSAEQQQEYLPGLPGGASLETTPLSPPQAHYFNLDGFSEIRDDGTLHGGFVLTAEGQSDASVRRMFTSSSRELWYGILEKELRKIHPSAMILSADWGDPYDYSSIILLRIEYDIPGYAATTDSFMIFTPLLASNLFARANNHLMMDTDKETRKYPFRDRCSRVVEISESVKFPALYSLKYHPDSLSVAGSVADYTGNYQADGNMIRLYQKLTLGKRFYEASDWTNFREAVAAQKKYAQQPIILRRAK